jgi:hypothetical protein
VRGWRDFLARGRGRGVVVVLVWLGLAGGGWGMEEFCLLIEPKDGPAVAKVLKGSRSTALVPGRETRVGGVRYYTVSEFEGMGLGWAGFTRKAEATATRVLEGLAPEVKKDGRGQVVSAVLRGRSHLTAGVVLSPRFYEMFRATMGDDLVLLIPDRFTVYVFPRPMGDYKALGPEILEAYERAVYPVSYEVLLLNKDGLSALGSFRDD